ncbi:MAG: hypothetical protein IKR49_00315 [Clostridia bacterium]|nr:hypothetical protein [Clostridia bacterium]
MSRNSLKNVEKSAEDLKFKAETLFECIRCESVAWTFRQVQKQLSDAVRDLDDPKDVVNTLSAFIDINLIRFEEAADRSMKIMHDLEK